MQGNQVPTARVTAAAVPPARVKRAAGADGAELRTWQLAMLELARRHSVLQVGGVGLGGAGGAESTPCCSLLHDTLITSEIARWS